jgi:hypothetical protein
MNTTQESSQTTPETEKQEPLAPKPIDRRFRFSLDFCIVWASLVVPVFLLTHRLDFGPWYSCGAILILLPLFATFALYGPVLLVRQIIRSGSRGWFVFRVFLSIVFAAVLIFGGLFLSGLYTEGRARTLAFFFAAAAVVYLNWKTEEKEPRT